MINLSILTPDGPAYQGSAATVVAPGVGGSFGILPRHAGMISALQKGVIKVCEDAGELFFVADKGFLEVRKDAVVVLAGSVQKAANLEEAKAIAKGGVD